MAAGAVAGDLLEGHQALVVRMWHGAVSQGNARTRERKRAHAYALPYLGRGYV